LAVKDWERKCFSHFGKNDEKLFWIGSGLPGDCLGVGFITGW
jgi:hypothetical protein